MSGRPQAEAGRADDEAREVRDQPPWRDSPNGDGLWWRVSPQWGENATPEVVEVETVGDTTRVWLIGDSDPETYGVGVYPESPARPGAGFLWLRATPTTGSHAAEMARVAAEEREACARICDRRAARRVRSGCDDDACYGRYAEATDIAALIRRRPT